MKSSKVQEFNDNAYLDLLYFLNHFQEIRHSVPVPIQEFFRTLLIDLISSFPR